MLKPFSSKRKQEPHLNSNTRMKQAGHTIFRRTPIPIPQKTPPLKILREPKSPETKAKFKAPNSARATKPTGLEARNPKHTNQNHRTENPGAGRGRQCPNPKTTRKESIPET